MDRAQPILKPTHGCISQKSSLANLLPLNFQTNLNPY